MAAVVAEVVYWTVVQLAVVVQLSSAVVLW